MVLKTNICIFLVKPVFFLSQKLTHVKSIHKAIIQIYLGIQIDWALSVSSLSVTDRTKSCSGVNWWHSFAYHGGMDAEAFLQVQPKQLKKQALSCFPCTGSYHFPAEPDCANGNHVRVKPPAWLNPPSAAALSDLAVFVLKVISSPGLFTWLS